ncbi:MAG: 6,7-dimethyl-8-ribityllumazine synthase [Bacteroidetes bacterium]|nr:6,7-dimethyl-8-ribityllumazine synthase [Bacteroidota bacterium]MCL1969301.1 6,7-dimethyl-8-ribityllumazine synthase [Bacteroidota bacterium]
MKKHNLSQHGDVPELKNKNVKIGIVVSDWNKTITGALKEGALAFLCEVGIAKEQIIVHSVPGSFELPSGVSMLLNTDISIDAVICLGCVIQGETRHFEFISQAVANGIMRVSLDYGVPVIFGVLTCDTMEQAQERAGGKHGNKGIEAAYTCLKMLELQEKIDY